MSDTTPSVGQALAEKWREHAAPSWHDMAADIDAAIRQHAHSAWRGAAAGMRDRCVLALHRLERPVEAGMVADLPLPWPAQLADAAIEQARREGAEAMREACEAAASNQRAACPYPSRDYSEGWRDAAGKIERDICALPLPGSVDKSADQQS